ncbi:MAG: hypothetical protein AAGD13_12650 [Pseudomonadota bacterium]
MSLLTDILVRLRAFFLDQRGAAGIEFLMTLPLLIGALILTAEYGKALRTRMVLTAATADVTNFLSRAPLAGDPADPTTVTFYPDFVTTAQTMMEARMGGPVTVTPIVFAETEDLGLRTQPVYIVVRTDVNLSLPMLGFINSTLDWAANFPRIFQSGPATNNTLSTDVPMAAEVNTVWKHSVEQIGDSDCSNVERAQDLCGTAPSAGGST